MPIRFIYMTTGSLEEARRIGRELVSTRLAACVNILPQMQSIYVWESKLQEDTEAVLIAKTTAARAAELIAKVKSLHSYSVPCVVSLAVEDGHPPFLEWIARSVESVY
jgi:periplasmic divalent cation tolerance protein